MIAIHLARSNSHTDIERDAPDTLLITESGGHQWIADPGDPLARSQITEGVCVTPVVLRSAAPEVPRKHPAVANLTVETKSRPPEVHPITGGENTVGRDDGNSIVIRDARVSRVHATLDCEAGNLTITDHRSRNGTLVAGTQLTRPDQPQRFNLQHPVRVSFGGVSAEIRPCDPGVAEPEWAAAHRAGLATTPVSSPATHADACEPHPPTQVHFPDLPTDPPPQRFPIVSALTPAIVGLALYLATHSIVSLLGIAVSPVIVIGSWCEQRWSRRRARAQSAREYEAALSEICAEIRAAHHSERTRLARQSPSTEACLRRIGFAMSAPRTEPCMLRCGTGPRISSLDTVLPARQPARTHLWERAQEVCAEAQILQGAPVCIGADNAVVSIGGEREQSAALLRALVVQAVSQHSPNELLVCVFAGDVRARHEWSWAAWLPHTRARDSAHMLTLLAHTERDAELLMSFIEQAMLERSPGTSVPGTAYRPRILVVLDHSAPQHSERMISLMAAHGPAHLTLLHIGEPPRMSQNLSVTTLDVTSYSLRLSSNEHTDAVTVDQWEHCSVKQAEWAAAALCQSQRPSIAAHESPGRPRLHLPASLSISELSLISGLRSPSHQEAQWSRSRSLHSEWGQPEHSAPLGTQATVGVSEDGPFSINLRADGPHALVAGTTGSGKSALLQTWILALAATHSSDRLTLFLIDFKGGSTFSSCAGLPHVVGLVTDLTPHLAQRAHTTLAAEIRHRERCLQELGAPDIETLERRSDHRAPPNLIVVVDEVAVLLREHPPFGDTLQDLAQRGRSLGIHLILATQRPSGVVSEHLLANITLRVALRVANPNESTDVLGCPDPASISRQTPGRCLVRIAAQQPVPVQTAYAEDSRSHYTPTAPQIQHLVFGTQLPAQPSPPLMSAPQHPHRVTVREEIIQRITATTALLQLRPPRKLWCDPLPTTLNRDTLIPPAQNTGFDPVIGAIDLPESQSQPSYVLPLTAHGNVLVWGAPRSGKTTTLQTITAEITRLTPASWVYVFASTGRTGDRSPLSQGDAWPSLPLTRICVIPLQDRERIRRACAQFSQFLDPHPSEQSRPHVIIVIDGLGSLCDVLSAERDGLELMRNFEELLHLSHTSGITILACGQRTSAVPSAWRDYFSTQLCHRVTDANDAHVLGVADADTNATFLPPGRALIRSATGDRTHEIQIVLPSFPNMPAADRVVWPLQPDVPALPARFSRTPWEAELPGAGLCALNLDQFHPIALPIRGRCVVTGPPGSGRTTTMRTLTESSFDRLSHQTQPFATVFVGDPESPLRQSLGWTVSTHDIGIACAALHQLGADTPGMLVVAPGAGWDTPVASPTLGHPPDHGSQTLIQLLDAASRRFLVLCEVPHRLPQHAWETLAVLRSSEWIFALQPDSNDPSGALASPIAQARRTDFRPGCGVLVRPGSQQRIQLALPKHSRRCGLPPVSARIAGSRSQDHT